jgi:hypothetical protein
MLIEVKIVYYSRVPTLGEGVGTVRRPDLAKTA